MIAAYTAANPDVKIAAQPGEFSSYWDKLATQTAGGTAPDIIQMDMNYISEYGTRGALLDLERGRHLQVRRGHGRLGQDRRQAGRDQRRHQQRGHLCQPEVFEKAKMDLPDDKTWTWDQMIEIGAEVASKAGVPFGVAQLFELRRAVRHVRAPARQGTLHSGRARV